MFYFCTLPTLSTYPDLNLFEFYRIVRGKLRLTVEDKFELDEKSVRKPFSELDKALREALANMIIHADYLDTKTSVKIVVDNLYYTFLNPGTMKISKNVCSHPKSDIMSEL